MIVPFLTHSGANISHCGLFRTKLWRYWPGVTARMIFVMLNPSTADARENDPTVRRCMAFARREGLGGIVVINLFTRRATDPRDLICCDDPKGPDADGVIRRNIVHSATARTSERYHRKPDVVVCAWGAAPTGPRAWRDLHDQQAHLVFSTAREGGVRLYCLGQTKDGHPRHPLYVRGDTPLQQLASRQP